MTDERLKQLREFAYSHDIGPTMNEVIAEIARLRAELAETQAEMKPLAAHVQRDFEQAEEIARLRTRNEKLQAELADCQRQAAAMREWIQDSCVNLGVGNLVDDGIVDPKPILSSTAGRGFVAVEVADKLAEKLRETCGCVSCLGALSAYEAAKGHDGTPPR